jgi:hypothetical protein
MNEDLSNVTQSDLISLGFSHYLVRKICKDLEFNYIKGGVKAYKSIDIKKSIKQKLAESKFKPKNRESLEKFLYLLEGQSNVIEVDFLTNLTQEQKIEFLNQHREALRAKGETIIQNVDELLQQAKNLS